MTIIYRIKNKIILDDAMIFTGTVNNYGTMNLMGGVYVQNGHLTLGEGSTTIFKRKNNTETRLVLWEQGATVTLKSAILDDKGMVANLATVGNANVNLYMNVYTDVSFGFLNQGTNDATLNITLYEDGILRFVNTTNSLKNIHTDIKIFNFEDNKIYVGNSATDEKLKYFKLYSGEAENTYLGTASVNNGWLVFATVVPEPAEWAMIFGGIALGLAIYRRRK